VALTLGIRREFQQWDDPSKAGSWAAHATAPFERNCLIDLGREESARWLYEMTKAFLHGRFLSAEAIDPV